MAAIPARAGPALVAIAILVASCQVLPPVAKASPTPHAICNRGTYRHIPGDFPEYGPPQTLYVGSTPDGIGSVYRVEAPAAYVTAFYVNGGGQLNYVFVLQGDSVDPASLLWREQSDFDCRGTLTVETDPADQFFTLYAAEPADAAFKFPAS